MKEEVILVLSELRSQINDTIMRVKKESPEEGKEMVSMLISCDFVDVYDLLKEETRAFWSIWKVAVSLGRKCRTLMLMATVPMFSVKGYLFTNGLSLCRIRGVCVTLH